MFGKQIRETCVIVGEVGVRTKSTSFGGMGERANIKANMMGDGRKRENKWIGEPEFRD